MDTFGKIVSNARKEKGMTLKKLSQFMNLSIGYLCDIERGRKLPPEERAKDLCLVLGLDFRTITHVGLRNPRVYTSKAYEKYVLDIARRLARRLVDILPADRGVEISRHGVFLYTTKIKEEGK